MYYTNTSSKQVLLFISPKIKVRSTRTHIVRKKCKCLTKSSGKCKRCIVTCTCLEHYILKRHEIEGKALSLKRSQSISEEPSPLLDLREQYLVIHDRSWLFRLTESDLNSDADSDTTLQNTSSESESSDEARGDEFFF